MQIVVFLYGLVIGSFLNVVIYRLPQNKSIVKPGSHCGRCQSPLKARDLVPVLSYIFLRGQCRYCHSKISWRYPLIELATGLLFVLIYHQTGLTPWLFIYALVAALLMTITWIDIDHMIIPDRLNVIFAVFSLIVFVTTQHITLASMIWGFILGGGLLYLIALIPNAMGGGDIKLMAAAGLFLGLKATIVAFYIAFILGGIVGLYLLFAKKKGKRDAIPFGPYLCVGIYVAMLYGNTIMNWYLYR